MAVCEQWCSAAVSFRGARSFASYRNLFPALELTHVARLVLMPGRRA
jgi:hypothetical protein